MRLESPAAPGCCCYQDQYDEDGDTADSHPATWGEAAVLNVFRKGRPLHLRGVAHTIRATAIFEAAHPLSLFEAQDVEITADEAAAKDTARELVELACFEGANMSCRNLGGFADGFDCYAAFFPCPPQVFAECRQVSPLPATAACSRR